MFCFASANLKSNKSLCGTVYRGSKPEFFYLCTTHRAPKPRLSRPFRKLLPISRRLFYPVYDRNMANLKNPFNSSETISFQIQLYCFSPDMLRVSALAYRVVTSTFFAQISLFLLLNPLFTRFSLPHFGHLSFLSIH